MCVHKCIGAEIIEITTTVVNIPANIWNLLQTEADQSWSEREKSRAPTQENLQISFMNHF